MRSRRVLTGCLFCIFFLFASSCASEHSDNRASSEQPASDLKPQAGSSSESTNSSPARPQSDSIDSQTDNQMSIEELRERLKEVKAIERESRRMVALRNDWMNGAAECHRIMTRLKPRAREVANEYKRMYSPAGMEIASAAIALTVCINCIENDDDTDCRLARGAINKAEREMRKEMRQK